MLFLAVSFVEWGRGLATLLLFLYITEEAGRKCVLDMPWPPAAECNMITNKQTVVTVVFAGLAATGSHYHGTKKRFFPIKYRSSIRITK